MDEEDDAKEYVAAAGAISSAATDRRRNHFSLSVLDITISIVPRSVYDLALQSWKYQALIIPSVIFTYTSAHQKLATMAMSGYNFVGKEVHANEHVI